MEVILLEKVHNLGNLGDKVKVKRGYGRNFLIPFNKAVSASAINVTKFEARRAELEAKAAKVLAEAEQKASQLTDFVVEITARAAEQGKLYGSVSARDIAIAAQAKGIELSKSQILMPTGAIRETGEFDIRIQLHSDVDATLKVRIVAE